METRTAARSTAFATEAGDDASLDATDTAETGCSFAAASGRHHTFTSDAGSSAPAAT